VGTWVAAFVATAAVAPVRLVGRSDEAWMLWVMHRVARGDVLYRDVYDVTTPLPAWLGAAVVRVAGAELLTLRLLVAAVVAAEVAVACSIVRHAGMRWRGRTALAVAFVALASPMLVFTSFYTACAVLGALVALRLLLWYLDAAARGAPTATHLVWVGVATALSFWCKPNIGLLTLAAVLATACAAGGRAWRTSATSAGIVAGAFAAIGVVVSLVIAATGAWSAFVDQVFRSKAEYLGVGFSFLTAVQRRVHALGAGDPIDARAIVWLLVLTVPVAAALACAWACRRAGRRVDAPVVAFVTFAAVGILAAVPRPGVDHLGSTVSLMITGAAGAVLTIPGRVPSHRTRGTLLVAGAVAAGLSAVIVVGAALAPIDLPVTRAEANFTEVPVARGLAHRARLLREGLARDTDGEIFFVRQDAGFLHFLTGTRDPLPYDIAERSDFGGADERGVIRMLSRGEAPWVCLAPAHRPRRGHDPLRPRALERWVRRNGDLTADLPMCDLYRMRAIAERPASGAQGPAPRPGAAIGVARKQLTEYGKSSVIT
jgi:hypothetical protein